MNKTKQARGRPARLRMNTDDKPATDGQIALRAAGALLAATNPIVAATVVALVVVCRWITKKIRAKYVVAVGLAATAIGLAAGWAVAYARPWRSILTGIRHAAEPHGIDALTHTVSANWAAWIAGQIPFGIALGTLIAGAYLAWRERYTAQWREKAEKEASARAVARGKGRLENTLATREPVHRLDDLTLPLGVNASTARPVELDAPALRTHGVVVGPTGLGKTEALQRLIWAMLAQPAATRLRMPAIVIDMKGDATLRAWLANLAAATDRGFHQVTVTPETSAGYNPLAGRTGDEIADALYEIVFADDKNLHIHYATLSRRLLQVGSQTLVDLAKHGAMRNGEPIAPTMGALVELLNLKRLRAAADIVSVPMQQRIDRYLADVKASKSVADVGDVRDRLAVITETDAGRILDDPNGLDLRAAIERGDIVCFSLDAAGSPETARTIGRLAVHDLSAIFGSLGSTGWGTDHMCPIILDEFSALATRKVGDLFARARSAGGAIILSTQDLDADLNAVGRQFAAAVKTNTNVWLVLRQTRGDIAEGISHDLGTVTTWKESMSIDDSWDIFGGLQAATGSGNLRKAEKFILHPNRIKSLPLGGAYLIVKMPTGTLNRHTAATRIERFHISQAPAQTASTSAPMDPSAVADVRIDGQTATAHTSTKTRVEDGVPDETSGTPWKDVDDAVPAPPDDY